ncbi:MAG: hypothetical protein J7L04_12265 [Bacteroidales bacterium]|nr:hypothetical protein [Bacteroidales bacterium]
MKNLNLFSFLLMCIAVFTLSCEGPAGPSGSDGVDGLNGSDGTDGVDGNITCLVCHSGDNMQKKKEEFNQSVHSAGQIAVDYAGGRASCAQCHSSEGFIEFALNGTVEENIASPSAWECKTCHGLHSTFEAIDYALRLDDPIEFIFDPSVVADMGNSNLCANCHQSRRAEPNITNPGETFTITSTHYGPHHGAQSNVLYGAGFAEIAGSVSYPTAGATPHMGEAGRCTGCHMDTYASGQGGHTFNPALSACNSCHGVTEDDFNYGGVQTTVHAQLEELRDLLLGLGVIEEGVEEIYELNPETGVIELVVYTDGYHPVKGTYPMIQAQAFFNWVGLEEDRSLGAHNPKYVKALLTNTIEALTATL